MESMTFIDKGNLNLFEIYGKKRNEVWNETTTYHVKCVA